MKATKNKLIERNSIFGLLALTTGIILLIPLIAMQFTIEVNWNIGDFVIMAMMLFGTSSLFVLVARKIPEKRRFIIGAIFTLLFLLLWTELAVGLLTN